jgi:ParB family chromosome partitioning protein
MAEAPREQGRARLGRGLAALIGDSAPEAPPAERTRGQRRVPIEFLRANPRNPRKAFSDAELEDLSNSIRERGVIQPILVRTVPGVADSYEIIAGERRWRASQRAGLHEVPILVVEADDKDALEIAIIENVQRSDLNPLEEALGYEQLAAEFKYTQQDLAKVIGKSRSHIANMLRLLKLPDEVRGLLAEGALSAGHARALLSLSDPESAAKQIVAQGLSVRDAERMAQREAEAADRAPRAKKEKDADTLALEQSLTEALGLVVRVDHQGEGGEVRLKYRTLDQLDALCARLKA